MRTRSINALIGVDDCISDSGVVEMRSLTYINYSRSLPLYTIRYSLSILYELTSLSEIMIYI